MSVPEKTQGICGFFWFAGVSPDHVENHETERHVSISERQWWMLAGLMQRCVEDTEAPNPATPHASWLEGFQMELRASAAQIAQDRTSPYLRGHGPRDEQREKCDTSTPRESHLVDLAGSQSVSHQDKTTSDSSFSYADGESAGETPTPSCKRIVIPEERLVDAAPDGSGNFVITLKNGGWK